jgi:hypothetical protein
MRASGVGDVLQAEKIGLARKQWEQEPTVNMQVQVQPPSSRKGAGLGSGVEDVDRFDSGYLTPRGSDSKLFQCNENRCIRCSFCLELRLDLEMC